MYYTLLNAIEDAMETLEKAENECEECYINTTESELQNLIQHTKVVKL